MTKPARPGSPQPLPDKLRALLAEHHARRSPSHPGASCRDARTGRPSTGVAAEDCDRCSSPCCLQSGFAILENVLLIHDRYRRGLVRGDHAFAPGLSLGDFVETYFDVTVRGTGAAGGARELLLFHPRSLSADGHPIVVPEVGEFYETRAALFDANPWLNRGCVFLSRRRPAWPEDDGDSGRCCLLHDPASREQITAKPIDCVLLTCESPGEIREVAERTSDRWFRELAIAFPGSVARYRKLAPG